MGASKRFKTKYAGIFYRVSDRIGGPGEERVYYAVYKKDGKVHETKVGRQYADAMTPSRASHIRAEIVEGKRLTQKEQRIKTEEERKESESVWTVDKLWNSYVDGRAVTKTLKTDAGRYEKFLKDPFGEKEPHEIEQLEVTRLRLRTSKDKSDQTVVHILNLLKRIVNYGYTNGLCDRLKFKIEKPKLNNTTTEDLTADELEALLSAIDQDENIQAKNLMRMALFTGMRRGELFKLQWADVDFDRGFITLRDPKGGVDQKIPMNDGARTILENHPRTKSLQVFPGRGGRQRVDINKQVNRIKNRAGLPKDFRPLHGLRHTYASMLASSGKVDMFTLQKLMTHKDPRMTQRYAHLRDEALKDASQVAGDIVNAAMCPQKKVVNMNDFRK